MRKLTNGEFISRSISIHGDKYDYSLVEYKGSNIKIKIICPNHGIFEQIANNHLNKVGCKDCSYIEISKKYNKGLESFIRDSSTKHGDKYDYSLVKYKNNKTKVRIICKEHGPFEQRPDLHLYSGCPICSGNNKKTTNDFIKESIKTHGDKYDYSLVNYINGKIGVKIICKEHGEFEQRAISHIRGSGCWKCKKNYPKSVEKFIEKATEVHGDIYDYRKSKYKNALDKIEIKCNKHGSFFQTPNKHITLKQGCPKCRRSKGVNSICKILDDYSIKYENEKYIDGCVSNNKRPLYFDIVINNNIAIEYDGEQHFIPIEKWGGESNLKSVKERDLIKDNFCKRNNIKLFRITYKDNIEEKVNYIISLHLQ